MNEEALYQIMAQLLGGQQATSPNKDSYIAEFVQKVQQDWAKRKAAQDRMAQDAIPAGLRNLPKNIDPNMPRTLDQLFGPRR